MSSYILRRYNRMQEDFSYKVYISDAIGGYLYGENRKRWSDTVIRLHERERYEEIVVDVEGKKSDFVRRFNKEVSKK